MTVRSFSGYFTAGSVSLGTEAESCLSTAPLHPVHLQDVYRDKSAFVLGHLKCILVSQSRRTRFEAKEISGKI